MKFLILILATVTFITCVFGAPICHPSVKDFKIKQQSIHADSGHHAHVITMPANALHYPRANLATPASDNNSPATVEHHTAAGWPRKFGHSIAARFAKKFTTAAAAKSNDKADCWAVNGNMPEECVDDNEGKGKGKVYATEKEQKKGEDLEQAKEDSKMWEGHLHWDGKDKM